MILDAARKIIVAEGVNTLSARKIAKSIGYTPGTLYLIFKNMDEVVQEANAETLSAILTMCGEVVDPKHPEKSLKAMADVFLGFVRTHPNEWDAVISYQYSAGHVWADYYTGTVEKIMGLLSASTDRLYSSDDKHLQAEEVRLLWASFYGIFSLSASDRLGAERSPDSMIENLTRMYLTSREASRNGARS